jgi:hypothetical protein
MPVGVYDPLRSDALLRVQGDHDAENSDPTAVQERKAYVGEAARYLPQAVVDKDIFAEGHPHPVPVSPPPNSSMLPVTGESTAASRPGTCLPEG